MKTSIINNCKFNLPYSNGLNCCKKSTPFSKLRERKTKECLKEYKSGLEKIMFMTSHKVRQPIAHILGISNLLDISITSQVDLKKSVNYLKQSAQTLDAFTKELTEFMKELKQKGEKWA
jgi:light-regulated signal transduction histidine kinase (bacteriophytochrome)